MAPTAIDVNDFDTRGSNAKVVDDVLQVTQVAGGQRGEAYMQLPALNLNEPFRLQFDMYIGDGSGAEVQAVDSDATLAEPPSRGPAKTPRRGSGASTAVIDSALSRLSMAAPPMSDLQFGQGSVSNGWLWAVQ